MKNNHKLLFLLSFLFLGSSGCTSFIADKRDAPALFDLGPPRAAMGAANPHTIDATLLIAAVQASAWLDNTSIQYRLTYQDAARTEAYAHNRWVSSPALLLTQRVRARFAAAARGVLTVEDGAKADYALRIELEDFSQSFDSAQSSKATVRLRASLIDLNTRALHAQSSFGAERPAAPHAAGAAQALAAASDAVVEELFIWAAQRLKK